MKRKKASSFLDLLESWFGTYLPTAKGLSPATIKSYKTAFRVMIEFMYSEKGINAGEIRFEDLTLDTISAFLDRLETERKYGYPFPSPSSQTAQNLPLTVPSPRGDFCSSVRQDFSY